jgi:hypothetical protein
MKKVIRSEQLDSRIITPHSSLDKSNSFLLGKPDLVVAKKGIALGMELRVLLGPNLWQRIVGARLSEICDMEHQKAKAPTIKIKREKGVGLLDATKEGTRINKYLPKQEDVFFDASDVFISNSVAGFKASTLKVFFPVAIGFTIWWAALPEFVIDLVPEGCLDPKWIQLMNKVMELSTVLKHGVPEANGTIGGIPMTDLVNKEAKEFIERTITFDPLDIHKEENRKATIVILFVAYCALAFISEEAFQLAAQVPVEQFLG